MKLFYGDISVEGDERREFTDYTYDTANWIVALPSSAYVIYGSIKAQTWFTYDTKGNMLTKKSWLDGGTNPVTTYTYDSYGNVSSVEDARNNTSSILYDSTYTYPVEMTNPLGHSVTKTYDARFGKVLTETDPNGNTTSYEYDVFGRIKKVTNPNDTNSTHGTVSYFYVNFGSVGNQKVVSYATEQSGTANTIWKETYFDGLGRTIKTRAEGPDFKAIVSRTIYNISGLVGAESLPYFEDLETVRWRAHQYDPIGRIIRTDNPDGTYATLSYLKGTLTTIDANERKRVEEKDVYGRVIKVEEYTGTSPEFTFYSATQYVYDVSGNLTVVTDAANNHTTIAYDTLSRKTSMDDPDMGYWEYDYDLNGNLTYQKDAKNQEIYFSYDELNRIRQKDYGAQKPLGSGDILYTYDETFSTNSKGRLTTLSDNSGVTRLYYDKLGRTVKTIKTINGVDYTTETAYDALGRTDTLTYPDGAVTKYEYDKGGNLSVVRSNTDGTVYASYSGYNALGQIGRTDYNSGLVNTVYQYRSDNNRLHSITTNSQASGGLMNLSYAYDNNGKITGITDHINNSRSRTYKYDDLSRLVEADSQSYGGNLVYQYDKTGNMTYNCKYGNYKYDDPLHKHAVTTIKDRNGQTIESYQYDANGNMTSGAGRAFTYDYDNRSESIIYGNSATISVYDAGGQRVKKVTPNATTIYIGKLYECTSGVCTKYIFGGSDRIASIKGAETNYYHSDHLGSSSIITDTSGNKVEDLFYYPYGEIKYNTGSVNVKHKFTGQEFDAENGLYYYGARYYDPKLARFVTADTIIPEPFNPQALNRYSYCANNPVIYADPSGNIRITIDAHWYVGGHYSYDTETCKSSGGGGVGFGAGIIFSDKNWSVGGGGGWYVDYAYDGNLNSSYITGNCGGIASGSYYFRINEFTGNIGGVGYSSFTNSWSLGAGYKGFGASYDFGTHRWRASYYYNVDAVAYEKDAKEQEQKAEQALDIKTDEKNKAIPWKDVPRYDPDGSLFGQLASIYKPASLGGYEFLRRLDLISGTDKSLKFGGLHVKVYGDKLQFHYDTFDAVLYPIPHLVYDLGYRYLQNSAGF